MSEVIIFIRKEKGLKSALASSSELGATPVPSVAGVRPVVSESEVRVGNAVLVAVVVGTSIFIGDGIETDGIRAGLAGAIGSRKGGRVSPPSRDGGVGVSVVSPSSASAPDVRVGNAILLPVMVGTLKFVGDGIEADGIRAG